MFFSGVLEIYFYKNIHFKQYGTRWVRTHQEAIILISIQQNYKKCGENMK
jgi:hypothetical protein